MKSGIGLNNFNPVEWAFAQAERHDEAPFILFILSIAHLLSAYDGLMLLVVYLYGLIALQFEMTSEQRVQTNHVGHSISQFVSCNSCWEGQ